MELAIKKGRYGYGNVFVFASGNGGINDDNCNFDGYANSIFTITIGNTSCSIHYIHTHWTLQIKHTSLLRVATFVLRLNRNKGL